jgi:hypothetical protein
MRYAWLTDIHLEFLKDRLASRFVKELASQKLAGLFLTGGAEYGAPEIQEIIEARKYEK